MSWQIAINGFEQYIQLEKGLAQNSIKAYLSDIQKLANFAQTQNWLISQITYHNLSAFMAELHQVKYSPYSRARMTASMRSFFGYLHLEKEIITDPTALLESPRLGRKLPDYLSLQEIDAIIDAIDLSQPFGQRNKTIIETLYSCGLRVSEVINLKVFDVHFHEQIILITGKGDKQRFVPIDKNTLNLIDLYIKTNRNDIKSNKGKEDVLFLNRFGAGLSRIYIFNLIKIISKKAGILKQVSPHTFRHSFATHLVQNGADLRSVQEMLGHESITTTEIYTHLNQNDLKKTVLAFHPRNR